MVSVQLVLIAGTDIDVSNGARVSLNHESQEFTDRDAGLVRRLTADGHSSPFAQAWAKFRIECSIGCSRQIARHAHYLDGDLDLNEHSTRYSEMPDEFVMPPLKRQIGKAMDYVFTELDDSIRTNNQERIAAFYAESYRLYQSLLADGISREDARYVLPLGMKTRLIVSGNLRGWLRFLAQRTDPHAQDEIRAVATEIEAHLRTAFPVSLDAWDSYGRRAP